jgi:acyl carrier protein
MTDSVEREVIAAVARVTGVTEAEILPTDGLLGLGIDSLGAVELIMYFEELSPLPDNGKLDTVQDLIDLVRRSR